MPGLLKRDDIIYGVSKETEWMVSQRMGKLRSELHDTISINPFLIPILYEFHHAKSFADLGELLLAGHLMGGHFTSFGKLIDEKILPKVFGTHKLDATYRKSSPPLAASCFNEIDHVVYRDNKPVLLSLKASRWTIQLTMAKEMNTAFTEIKNKYKNTFPAIVVGVFTGTNKTLTDKYDILRGINRGAVHDVTDLTDYVTVHAGRTFWSWLNAGEPKTQDWVLDGVLEGLRKANCRQECKLLLTSYTDAFNKRFAKHINTDGSVNWHQLLSEING